MPLVTLQWDLGTAAGYNMLVGSELDDYTFSKDVGYAASGSITVPLPGWYYSVVEPYDGDGNLGGRSQVVFAEADVGHFRLRR